MTLFDFTTKGRLGRADLLYGVLVPLTVLVLSPTASMPSPRPSFPSPHWWRRSPP